LLTQTLNPNDNRYILNPRLTFPRTEGVRTIRLGRWVSTRWVSTEARVRSPPPPPPRSRTTWSIYTRCSRGGARGAM